MVKLIGGILVVIGSGLGGMVIANALRARTRELQQFIRALHLLITEIGFGLNPLEVAFQRVAQSLKNSVGFFFSTVAQQMHQCNSAGTAWREAIQCVRSSMSCSTEDWVVLEEFASSLGLLDKENQINLIEALIARLEERLLDAQERLSANGRIYRYSGFAIGLMMVLIFI